MRRLAILVLLISLGACVKQDPSQVGGRGAANTFTIQTEAGLAVCVSYYGGSGSAVDCTWPDR